MLGQRLRLLSFIVLSVLLGTLAAGCSSDPAAQPQFFADAGGEAGGQASLSVDAVMHDFGTVTVGAPAATATFVVTNAGTFATGALQTALSGDGAASFRVDTDACAGKPLATMASCSITVRFAPDGIGGKQATLAVSGDPGGSASIRLSGTGGDPGGLTIAPATQDFGTVAAHSTSAATTFTVTNGAMHASGVLAVNMTGTDGAQFTVSQDGCSGRTLETASTCTVKVVFAPTVAGPKSASLSVSSSAAGTGSAMLSGIATTAGGAIVVTPSSQDFGTTVIGTPTTPITFTVTNKGAGAAGQPSATLSGTNASAFVIASTTCNGTLAPGASCTYALAFDPISAGAKSASLVLAASPGGTSSAALSGHAVDPASLGASPATFDFGPLVVGSTTAPTTVTITNQGGSISGVPVVALGGTDATQFVLGASTCTGALGPGASCAVRVAFAPTTLGAKSASLTVTASPGGTATTTLAGTGIEPGALSIAPVMHDFGALLDGTTSAPFGFTVTNTGGTATGVPTVTVAGTDAGQFTTTANGCTAALAPNDTCTIQVAFAPTTPGAKTAALRVSALPGGTATSSLTGTGLGPATLSMTPNMADFGSLVVGATSADQTFTVTNTGGVPSTTPTVSLVGTDPTQFAIASNGCTAALPPAGTCTITAHFAPGTPGAKSASLQATAATGGTTSAALSGNALAQAALAISPATNDFGSVVVGGTSSDVTFTVRNTGGVDSGVPAIVLAGTDPSQFVIATNGCTAALPPGGTCLVEAHFAPTTAGGKSASLQASATPGGVASSAISGTGLTPGALSIMPTTFDFGDAVTGTSTADQSFTVQNTGQSPAGAPTVTLSGTDAGQFLISSNGCTAPVPANGTCTIAVHFAPITTGAKAASLDVSATPGGSAVSTLKGNGLAPAQLTLTPPTVDYGQQVIGTSSSNVTFTLTNNGGATSGTITASLAGADAGQFGVGADDCTGRTLAPNASCLVTVHFSPNSTGAKGAQLSASASPGGTTSAALSGTGITAAALAIAPPSNDFGAEVVGGTTTDFPFVVTNGGEQTSGTPTVALGGTNPSDFTITANGCTAPLSGGASCTVRVAFAPGSSGNKSAQLGVSASPGGTAQAMVAGNGLTVAQVTVSPGSETFPDTVVGGQTADVPFVFTNNGQATSGAVAPALGGVNANQFVVTADGCSGSPLAGGASCTVRVAFAPTATGAKSATLSATATPGGTASATLGGSGLAQAQLGASPLSEDFMNVVIGQSSADATVTITNGGNVASGALSVARNGLDPADFVITADGCSNATLAGGASCTITLHFAPTAAGPRTASLDVSATPGGSVSTSLAGTGQTPATLTINPGSADFGAIAVGMSSAPTTFTVQNTGDVASGAVTAALSGADAADFVIGTNGCAGVSLSPNATCSVQVSFAPQSAGTKGASLGASASPGGSVSSTLSGTATAAIGAAPTAR